MENKEIQIETFKLGKRMIESALKLDENLADLLKLEIQRLRKLNRLDGPLEDLGKTNQLIKSIIYAITLNSDKITNGLNLCRSIEEDDY